MPADRSSLASSASATVGFRRSCRIVFAANTAGFGITLARASPSWRFFIALLTQKQIRRGVHRSTRELEAAIERYISIQNERPKPFVWTKTADEILASVGRFCQRISNSGHW